MFFSANTTKKSQKHAKLCRASQRTFSHVTPLLKIHISAIWYLLRNRSHKESGDFVRSRIPKNTRNRIFIRLGLRKSNRNIFDIAILI